MNLGIAIGRRRRAGLLVAFAVLLAGPAAGQIGYKVDPQGKDELWDVTSKMEMSGMPMAMPAQTRRVCIEKGNDEATVPKNEGCTVVESKRVGNRFTYKMACRSGKNDYTATGESTSGANGYQGKMRMAGRMEGSDIDMTMTYAGTRAGSCTSTIRQDVAVMKAQSDKAVADVCRDGLDKLQWTFFLPEGQAACKGQAGEFCAAVGRAAQSMRDPKQHAATTGRNPDVRTSFAKCGQDFDATTQGACARAGETRDWRFVGGGNCDDGVRRLGKIHCEERGRSPDPEYFPLCSRYVTITRGSATANAPAAPASQPARAPAAQDPMQQGLDAVRKLLPF